VNGPGDGGITVAETRQTQVTLGCGTLVLIALIVMFFSGKPLTDLSPVLNRLNEVDRKLDRLQDKLDELSRKLEAKK
jgi:hypothetical protein